MDIGEFSRQYFCITAENYENFSPWLYGWRLKNDLLQANCALGSDEDGILSELDDPGNHICLCKQGDGCLRLTGDPVGNSMLWLYRKGNFWAISNSWWLLETTLRYEYNRELTLNTGFAAQLLLRGASPLLAGESLANEISLLPPGTEVLVDIHSGDLDIKFPPVAEERIDLLSEEGVGIVDKWINKWFGLVRAYIDTGVTFITHVTGGFDSRNGLALVLGSGADVANVRFYSSGDDDLPIARQLAARAGFTVKEPYAPEFYTTDPEIVLQRYNLTRGALNTWRCGGEESGWASVAVSMSGLSGELHRGWWARSPLEFYQWEYTNKFGLEIQLVAQRAFVKKLYDMEPLYKGGYYDLCRHPQNFMLEIYRLTRHRFHFGTASSQTLLTNNIVLQPLADPLLLKLHQDNCPDYDTLFAFIMERIGKGLRYIPHDNGRKFSEEAIVAARKLNRSFPFRNDNFPHRSIEIDHKPIVYDKYSGNYDSTDLLRFQIKKCLPIFSRAYPSVIAREALEAEKIYLTSGPHIPLVSEYLR